RPRTRSTPLPYTTLFRSLPNVVLLFWSLPDGVENAERFFADLQEEPRKRDIVYLKNGDRIEGTLTALDAKAGCTLTAGARKVQTDRKSTRLNSSHLGISY